MSCFTINKQDYARVGALFGAFTEIQDRHREPMLYKYNFQKGRLCDWKDIVEDFTELYKINLESVNDNYDESNEDTETINFEECLKYKDYMRKLYMTAHHFDTTKRKEFKDLIFNIYHFFRSVNYQIDNQECSERAQVILGRYEGYLLEILKNMDCIEPSIDCWGAFELAFE